MTGLPDGQIAQTCPAYQRKIFRFRRRANHLYKLARLVPTRGAYRDRHGRRARDAMDVEVLLTNGTDADDEVVWAIF